jgi:hypothetical protein
MLGCLVEDWALPLLQRIIQAIMPDLPVQILTEIKLSWPFALAGQALRQAAVGTAAGFSLPRA